MDTENQDLRASRLGSKVPGLSGIPRPGQAVPPMGLSELSAGASNARSQMPPPAARGSKREISQNAHMSEPKRKLLSERAVEYPKKEPALSGTNRPNISATSLVNASTIKPPSAHGHSRNASAASISSRQASSTNFAKSVGPTSRAPPARPKTSHSNYGRSVNGRHARPQTALGHRPEEEEDDMGEEENAWDVTKKMQDMEQGFKKLEEMVHGTTNQQTGLVQQVDFYKVQVSDLREERDKLLARTEELHREVGHSREKAASLERRLEDEQWRHGRELEQIKRSGEHARDDLQRSIDDEVERLSKAHQEELEALKRHYSAEMDDERRDRARELQELQLKLGNEQQGLHGEVQKKERDVSDLRGRLESLQGDLDREITLKARLQESLDEMAIANRTTEARMASLRSQIEFLESDCKAQSDSFSTMETRMQEANQRAELAQQKLIKEETERRILFNKYQELKGNIRVMCRVRPVLDVTEGDSADLSFPDEKTSAKIGVLGPEETSSLGNISRKEYPFEFDRVFDPKIQNDEIFGEISQLVQSALDGYNVCIFCYGQTGSGKTYTMSSVDGVIPRATHMIYDTIMQLKEKSWSYSMEGSFIEVYNEELNDLLTPNGAARGGSDGKKKLEIKHDEARKTTMVTNCKTVSLDSPEKVESMLAEAQRNRSVAATRANERSSRSHSVFVLRLVGENAATGERCEGTLNLVDLAGSERVKHSGAEGDRMKEAQNINKSLSCLGDVIDALGKGSAHVPYRNSRLTHLLQYSLGGNSKTLMFVMVSPLEAHLKETLTSLRFAAKVHNTHIGTAKATKKIKDRDSCNKGDS